MWIKRLATGSSTAQSANPVSEAILAVLEGRTLGLSALPPLPLVP